jgi:nitroimidazol reductase NimA-like FMN-containing flavoprotein (pyridoxamine 5'-phosphate oxidase superfamily)
MRREDREITGIDEKLAVIARCKVCRLGLSDNGKPYVVPLNYGWSYEDGVLIIYLHGAGQGKKWDIIKNNAAACFEVDCGHQLIEADEACRYAYAYQSVIGFGNIHIIEALDDKRAALRHLMKHQTGKDAAYSFDDRALKNTAVYKLVIETFTGKQRLLQNA